MAKRTTDRTQRQKYRDVKLQTAQVQKCHTEQTKPFIEPPASAECNQYSSGVSGSAINTAVAFRVPQ